MKKAVAAKAWDYIVMVAAAAALADILMQAFVVPDSLRTNIPAMAAVAGLVLAVLTACFFSRRAAAVSVPAMVLTLAGFAQYLRAAHRLPASLDVGLLIPVLFYLIAGGAAVVVFVLSRTRVGTALLFAVSAGAGCVMWLIGYTVSTPVYLVCLAAVAVLFLRRQFQASARRFPHVDLAQGHVTAAAAGITALALLVSCLTYSLTDRLIPTRFTVGRDFLTGWLQGGAQATAGYDPTGAETKLGGPLSSDSTPVMDVRTDRPFYLKGAAFSTYTGHNWSRQDIPVSDSALFYWNRRMAARLWMPGYIYENDRSAFHSLSPLSISDTLAYYRTHNTPVTPQSLTVTMLTNSRNFFLPAGYVDAVHEDQAMFATAGLGMINPFLYVNTLTGTRFFGLDSGNNDFDATSNIPMGAEFAVTAPWYDMSSPGFQSAADAGESDFDGMLSDMAGYYHNPALVSDYQKYYGSIREIYARPDAAVTARTRKLALSITRSSRTVSEKVGAVQAYLAHGFTYTLSPKRTPQGRDFIDYFLFSGKEGYCVHFASAMTELLRCAGVPARYVEGYVAPPDSQDGVYHVTRNQAHAWVEVYSSLLGWYPVEATPGFSYVSESAAAANTPAESAASSAVSSQASSEAGASSAAASSAVSAAPGMSGGNAQSDIRVLLWLILLLAGLALLFWLVRRGMARLRLWRIRRLPPAGQAVRLYACFLQLLEWLGCSRRPEETPEEFARRLNGYLGSGGPEFIRATGIFGAVRYGGREPTAEEIRFLWQFRQSFARLCRCKAGWFRRLLGPPV